MTNRESSWINVVRNIKLTPSERDLMRRRLVQFMETHPSSIAESSNIHEKFSRDFIKVKLLTYKSIVIALIIALVAGGSVSFAAENTIPGDILYPVKVYVNEPARAVVALTDKSKAELAVELVNRRLEEAGKLAVRGAIDTDTEVNVVADVESHVKDARKKLTVLKSHDEEEAAEVEVDLNSVLNAHSVVLAKAKKEKRKEYKTESVRSIDALSATLARVESEDEDARAITSTITMMMNASSTPLVTREDAEGKKNAARNKLAEVAQKLDTPSMGIATTTAQVKFAEAQGVFAQGEISFDAGIYAEAFNAFKQTIRLAQQTKRLADLEDEFVGEFNVNLHESDDEGDDIEDDNTTISDRNRGKNGNKRNEEGSSKVEINMHIQKDVDNNDNSRRNDEGVGTETQVNGESIHKKIKIENIAE